MVNVIAQKPVAKRKMKVRCTDKQCRKLLEYTKDDIKDQTISCCGRDAGTRKGIGCPDCAQILSMIDLNFFKRMWGIYFG